MAFLAVSKTPLPFNSLEEMALQKEFVYGTFDNNVYVELFKVSSWKLNLKMNNVNNE